MQGGEWLTPGKLYAIEKERKELLEKNRALEEKILQLESELRQCQDDLNKALSGAWN